MTNAQYELVLEFLGTIDLATGMMLDGLDSHGGLDYTKPIAMELDHLDLNGELRHLSGLEMRDHTALKAAFAGSESSECAV